MNIIITGTSSGIGYEMVKLFAKESTHTIIAISRNQPKLEKLKKECQQINPTSSVKIISYDLNLFIQKNYSQELSDVLTIISHIDILINNAGLLIHKPFAEFDIDEMQEMFNVNFFSQALLIRYLLPFMGKEGHSHIINISSMGGFQGSSKFNGLSHYSASKAALANLTECLAEEYKGSRISFNCLALGAVETEMLNKAFPGYQAPLKASEMASFIVDFAKNGWKYFNGKILPVAVTTP
jgi:3-oxoacyl-[acyl-carrier protein] reductase